MTKRLNKKGFTLVELVIVIAVIAILAAVLIPTFSSIVKKANMSADQQAVRQMNTILATEEIQKEIETVEEVRSLFLKNGYNVDAYTPMTQGTRFYWVSTVNRVIYVNEADKTIIYPLNLEVGNYNASTWFTLDIDEGNLSVDEQAVNFMNEILSKYDSTEVYDLATLYAAFANKGWAIEGYTPLDPNSAFYYIPEEQTIVLADKEKNLQYPLSPEILDNNTSSWEMLGRSSQIDETGRLQGDEYEELKGDIKVEKYDNPNPNNLQNRLDNYDFEDDDWENGLFYIFSLVENYELTSLMNEYINWIPDYAIIINDNIEANSGGIVGCIWGYWSAIISDTDLEAGTQILLLRDILIPTEEGEKPGWTCEDLTIVNPFTCGAFSLDDSNSGKSITVQLRLYNPDTIGEELEEYIVLSEILCVFK